MSTIVEISIPADEFALGRALQAESQLQVELERIIPTGTAVFPFFWAWGDNVRQFEAAVRAEPVIQDLTRLDSVSDGTLFRAVWNDEITGFVQGIEESNATVMEANGTVDGWTFHLRFPGQDQMSSFQSFCCQEGIPVEVHRVYSLQDMAIQQLGNLTPAQQETLITAYEEGYFERPRDITLEELADELMISPQAVGGRLRRGYANLISGSFRSLDG
ncbi:helix-turn-helix domain-containing protein [Haladaptatus sp. DFWS20]|uniref:helix-turn-helix domain-containing protein n=1 Tax=Haladaptatus sp. DFWS20 TaxID=3403467 RepID=UPI003EB6B082